MQEEKGDLKIKLFIKEQWNLKDLENSQAIHIENIEKSWSEKNTMNVARIHLINQSSPKQYRSYVPKKKKPQKKTINLYSPRAVDW